MRKKVIKKENIYVDFSNIGHYLNKCIEKSETLNYLKNINGEYSIIQKEYDKLSDNIKNYYKRILTTIFKKFGEEKTIELLLLFYLL